MKQNRRRRELVLPDKHKEYLKALLLSLDRVGIDKDTSRRVLRSVKSRIKKDGDILHFLEIVKSTKLLRRSIRMELIKYLKFLIANELINKELISGEQS